MREQLQALVEKYRRWAKDATHYEERYANESVAEDIEAIIAASQPAEDPDEWVTQDRVHMRPNIDETRWVRDIPGDRWVGEWKLFDGFSISYMHGAKAINDKYHRIEVRCKRRDLPPIPEPKPATQTIVFHECIVRHGNPTDFYSLEWLSDVPKHSNWIATGLTETREVKR